jgi:hypothetical protein
LSLAQRSTTSQDPLFSPRNSPAFTPLEPLQSALHTHTSRPKWTFQFNQLQIRTHFTFIRASISRSPFVFVLFIASYTMRLSGSQHWNVCKKLPQLRLPARPTNEEKLLKFLTYFMFHRSYSTKHCFINGKRAWSAMYTWINASGQSISVSPKRAVT